MVLLFRSLLNQAGMILVFAFLFSRVSFFRRYIVSARRRPLGTIAFILFFGLIGILGTYTGIPIRGALANSRIIGVFVAGLLGGPLVGLGAGLLAGFHRWAIDVNGFTALACMISTIAESGMAGLLSDRFYRSDKKWLFAMLAGCAAEVMQMIIILLVARPFTDAVELVKVIAFPMIVANGFGIGMFVAIIEGIFRERDRVAADQAQTTLRIASRTLERFREGFDAASAEENARIILSTLDVAAVSFTDTKIILSHVGLGADHHVSGMELRTDVTREVIRTGMYRIASNKEEIGCSDSACRLRSAIIVPLQGKRNMIGTLKLYKDQDNAIGHLDVEMALGLANLFATQIELSRLEEQNKLLAKAELHALQAQINPHFLFNAINTIASLTRSEPGLAHDLLIHLGSFFRKNLNSQDELVPLREELEQVKSYLKIEQARFGDKLSVRFDIPSDADCLIPPLALQPIVENAVKHGIQKKIGPGTVTISARKQADGIELSVTDDGIGMSDERSRTLFSEDRERKSIGLMNINERLVKRYGPAYALSVSSEPGNGTTVRVRVPRETDDGKHRSPSR
ncbi:MAG: histidine kinase [Treponema sp. GWC1_61_84]|nr:MAG: histidine kinase [Treponema sp. GWC1_61_84]